MKPLKEVSHALAKTGLEQIEARGYSYAFHQHQPINKVLKVGMAFSNRIVSTAYVLTNLINGEESPSSSPAITLVDVDESLLDKEDKIASTHLHHPKQFLDVLRIAITDWINFFGQRNVPMEEKLSPKMQNKQEAKSSAFRWNGYIPKKLGNARFSLLLVPLLNLKKIRP